MADMIDFESEKVSRHLEKVFRGFLIDPAHSKFQQGYLMALIDLYREGMGKEGDERIAQLEAQVRKNLAA